MTSKKQIEKQLEARIEEWESEIDESEDNAKVAEASAISEQAYAEAKRAAWEKADLLQKRIKEGEKRLAQLKQSGEEDWESLKADIEGLIE